MPSNGEGSGSVAAAVDLGASSGRVVVGRLGAERVELTEVARFDNEPRRVDGVWRWDLEALWRSIGIGVAEAVRTHGASSVGVDSWAVDYGLLDGRGELISDPACYRDERTEPVMERVSTLIDRSTHYRITGVQYQPFNTVYQLLAEPPGTLATAKRLLMMPDLLVHLMTGSEGAERTNASSTGLYEPIAAAWSGELCSRLGIPSELLPALVEPGSSAGAISADVLREWGLPEDSLVDVVRVASHDTASAVAAVPADTERFAYISCGTWSLVGLELAAPVLTEAAMAANFTNETGIDGTTRFLRNVTGLWLLSECLREWQTGGVPAVRDQLLQAAAALPARRWSVDATSAEFMAPGGMPERITRAAARRGPEPGSRAEIVRCIIDSLASAHAEAVCQASDLAGQRVDVVHIVGGGSANALLCQATADACVLPVVAGPIEATALGNLLVQARAAGILAPGTAGRTELRRIVRLSSDLTTYQPGQSPAG